MLKFEKKIRRQMLMFTAKFITTLDPGSQSPNIYILALFSHVVNITKIHISFIEHSESV